MVRPDCRQLDLENQKTKVKVKVTIEINRTCYWLPSGKVSSFQCWDFASTWNFNQNVDGQTDGHRQSIDRNCLSNPPNKIDEICLNVFKYKLMLSKVGGIGPRNVFTYYPDRDEFSCLFNQSTTFPPFSKSYLVLTLSHFQMHCDASSACGLSHNVFNLRLIDWLIGV